MALAARAQQEALLQLVSFASLSASFTAPALRPPIGPDLNLRDILLFVYVLWRRFFTRKLHPFVAYFGALSHGDAQHAVTERISSSRIPCLLLL